MCVSYYNLCCKFFFNNLRMVYSHCFKNMEDGLIIQDKNAFMPFIYVKHSGYFLFPFYNI